ncbi:MAG: LamG domain-containing protein, partial [Candidatus Paceibacterota bacterium]
GSQQAITDGGILPGVLEIGSTIAQTPSLRDRGLVGYWTFDESSGITAYDRSGYSNNGTLTNSPTWQTSTNCKRGSCLSFDGATNYVGVPYAASLAPVNQISFMLWANRSGVGEWRILSKTETGGYGFNTDIAFYLFRNGTYGISSATSHGGWLFVAGVFDGRYAKLYIDGVLANTNDAGGNYSITYSCSNSLIIGAEAQCSTIPTTPFFAGYVDDVRIYNRALSAAEILSIYNSTK